MKKRTLLVVGLISLVLTSGLALTGCGHKCDRGCGRNADDCSKDCDYRATGLGLSCKDACK